MIYSFYVLYKNAKKGYAYLFLGKAVSSYLQIHTGLTWWSIAFTSFLKLSIRVEAIPRLSCPSSSTATLHIYVFWGCLERPRKQLCAARNSRLLAACIILPEICSRGFSLRPLFDACWQYWLQGCAGGLLVNSPKSARLRMWPRSPMGVPIHIHVCMKAWPLLQHKPLVVTHTQGFGGLEYREPQLHSASRIKKNFGTAKGSPFPTNFDCMHNIIAGRENLLLPLTKDLVQPLLFACVSWFA